MTDIGSDSALVDRFLHDPTQAMSARRRDAKRRALLRFATSLRGAGLLEAGTTDVERWLASCRPLSHTALRDLLGIVHGFYVWCGRLGLAADVPTAPLMSQRLTDAQMSTAARLRRLDRLSAVPGGHRLDTAAAAYVAGRMARRELAALTVPGMRQALSGFCDVVGDVAPAELDRDDVEWWLASIRRLAPATRRNRFSIVKGFLGWLVVTDQLARDPSAGIAAPRVPRSVHRSLSGGRAAALLDACVDTTERLVVTLGLQLGLRRAEIAGLEVGDVDMAGATLVVRRGKGGHQRVLPLPDDALDALARYLAEHRIGAGPLVRGKLYPHRGVPPMWVGRMVSRLAYDADVKIGGRDGVGTHSLRHTCASDIYSRTHDVLAVRDVLGHVSLATTQGYVRGMDVEGLREAMSGRTYRSP